MERHIILTCPACGESHKVDSIYAAEKFTCTGCGRGIPMPRGLGSDELTIQDAALVRPPAAPALAKANEIAGCVITGKLGQGGMGTVYRAHHKRLDKEVALKVLTMDDATAEAKNRFLDEARSAAKLEHPNIVAVYDVGEERGTYYIIMQLVEGESLEKLIDREGGLEPERAAKILRDVSSALKVAHDRNLIHRDIKPDNVFVGSDGSVKLGDFGIVRDLDRQSQLTQAGVVLGTPYYMAPERFESSDVDRRSDIYALGITFYHMLSGRRPFEGDTPYKVMYQHMNDPLPDLRSKRPDVPKELVDIAVKASAKSPDERYQTVDELMSALDAFLVGAGPIVTKKSPILIGIVAVLIIALGVMTALFLLSKSELERVRSLLAKGDLESLVAALPDVSKLSGEGAKEVRETARKRVLAELKKVQENPEELKDKKKVQAIKKVLAGLEATGIDKKEADLARKAFKDEVAKKIIEKGMLDDLDNDVRKLLEGHGGITVINPTGTGTVLPPGTGTALDTGPLSEEEIKKLRADFEEFRKMAYDHLNFKMYQGARDLMKPYLESKDKWIGTEAKKVLKDIDDHEKRR